MQFARLQFLFCSRIFLRIQDSQRVFTSTSDTFFHVFYSLAFKLYPTKETDEKKKKKRKGQFPRVSLQTSSPTGEGGEPIPPKANNANLNKAVARRSQLSSILVDPHREGRRRRNSTMRARSSSRRLERFGKRFGPRNSTRASLPPHRFKRNDLKVNICRIPAGRTKSVVGGRRDIGTGRKTQVFIPVEKRKRGERREEGGLKNVFPVATKAKLSRNGEGRDG